MCWNLLPTDLPTVSNSQNLGESTPTGHYTQHTPNQTPTRFQDPSLHIHSPPPTHKSNSSRLQPIDSSPTHHRCLFGSQQGLRHCEHPFPHQQTTPNKCSEHCNQIHRKLHQRTQRLHPIPKLQIQTATIQNWCSPRRCTISSPLQSVHL